MEQKPIIADSDTGEKPKLIEILQSRGRLKILLILMRTGQLNITKIAQQAHLSHKTTEAYLEILKKGGIVEEKRYGRIRLYRFMGEVKKVKAIKDLFDLWEKSDGAL